MTDSKYDISKGKELYKAVTSLSNLDRTEEDFLGRLQDQEYAKKVYNTFKEDNLLGAKDEQSFLDSLGFNKSSEPAKVEQSVPQKDSSSFFGVQMPNIDDSLSVEIPQVTPVAPKVPDMTMKVLENPFGQTRKLGEMRMSDFVGETPEQRLMAQINTLGTDAISDAAKAETIKAEIEKQLRDIDANNADFLKEYTTKLQEAGVNDTNLHHDSWSPIMPWDYKKRKKDSKYLDDHAAYYNNLMEKKKQLQRQYDLVNTFSKYANYGRQLEVQKQLSSMVSNGDLPAYAMETLTSAKNEEERDAYLKSLYDNNEIDKDTMKDIYNLGDLTKDNGFVYGLTETANWGDILSLGMNEIARDIDLIGLVQKMKAGDDLSDMERNTLNTYFKLLDIQEKASGENKEYGFGFNAGLGFQKSLRFIVEAGLTGGVGGAGKSLGIKGTKELIEQFGLRGAIRMVGGNMAKRAGRSAVSQLALTPTSPSMYANYSDRLLNLELDTEGEVSFGQKVGAAYKAYVDTFTERYSEALGGIFDDIPWFTLMTKGKASKPLVETIFGTLSKASNTQAFSTTAKILKEVGVTGIPSEIMSELSGNLMNGILTFDSDQFKAFTDLDFYKEVALTSAIMGGAGGATSYIAGGVGAVVQKKKMQKMYEKSLDKMAAATFTDQKMEALKQELMQAMANQRYITTDKSSQERSVADIMMEMNDIYMSKAPVGMTTEQAKVWMETTSEGISWKEEGLKLGIVDNAVRTGAYRYGEQQVIKDYVAQNMGVKMDEKGKIIPMDFEHEDGSVYEFTDTDGKQYFILDNSDDAVVLIDRTTGEKVVRNKSVYDVGTIKQSDANAWAMEEMLINSSIWNAKAQPTDSAVANNEFKPASMLEIDGQLVPVKSYDPATDKYTIADEQGNEVEFDRTDPSITEVEVPVENQEVTNDGANEFKTDDLDNTEKQNNVDNTDTGSDIESQGDQTEQVEQMEYDEEGNPVWLSASAERGKQEIDSAFEGDEAKAFVADKVKEAEKALKKLENKKPKATNIRDRKAEIEQIKKDKETAQANLDYWNSMSQLYNAPAEEIVEPVAENENVVSPISEAINAKVAEWSNLGVKVNVANSVDDITNEKIAKDIKDGVPVTGWYDTSTGEVYVYAPNLTDTTEIDKTIIHEVVAHKGLRNLIGESEYQSFCERVFDMMPKELQDEYMAYPGVNGRKAAAADEYIAYLAEKEDLTAEEQKFWDRIIQFFRDLFDARLVSILKKDTITDADISKLIRMSYANIKNNAQNGVSSDNIETDTTEGEARYSIDTMYEAVGLRYEKGNDGETIIKNAKGDIVGEITEEMIDKSPLGISLVDAVKNGMITEKERKQQLSFYKDLYNMHLRVNDLDLIYAVSGALGFQPVEPGPRDVSKSDINGKKQPFAAITSNADKQYSTTIDFTTICKKTQAVINNMSTIMVKLGRGLTKEEIVDIVFKNTHKAGEPVPCPVCYVFSRWVGLGGLFDNIKRLQNKYADADVETLRRDIAILNEKVDAIAEEYDLDRTDSKKKLRKELQEELDKLSRKEEFGKKLTDKEKALADKLTEQIFQIDNLTWLTDVRTAEGYKPVPDHILFDINAGVEFASEYPLTWKFRTTRGPSMGKAASPYSPLHFGQVMLGIGKSDLKDIKDPSKNMVLNLTKKGVWNKNIDKALRASRVKAKVQNLLNGQRLQSTSDWRFEYALDQLLAMIELQNIGAKAQLYTKVAEAIPFFATCNAEVNCSLMPKGDGYKINEDGSMELVFSRVTGMDERDAFMYSSKYDNVQPILVGINDTHMRLAMRDGRITFIIPFHASGGAEAQYKSMMEALGERYDDKREDYSPYQSDRRLPEEKRTKAQNDAYDLRIRILHSTKTGKDADTGILNDAERAVLENNAILRNLYERFYGKTIDGKEIKVKDPECYQVSVGTDQSKLIFPYEYWDKTTTIETADVNGARFIEYCNALGIVPRFSGYNGQFKYNAEKDFTKDENGNPMPGYWKLLIDRKMYNNDGTYHIQMPVNVTNMDASYIDPKTPRPEISTPSRNNNPAKEAEVVKKSLQEIRDNEQETNDGPRYRTSAEIDKEYPNWMEGTTKETGKKGHSTQVTKTVGTYNKVGSWIESNLGKDVEILDASSGMGLGTQSLREQGFNIEDVEPYQSAERKQNNPATYSAYADIEKQYDYIISNAVLNVIPDDWRADVLHNMAVRMKDGGKMFINTRMAGQEKDIKDKIELDSPQEVLVKTNGKISSYQKFFTPQELKSWVEQELGEGYTVEVANEKNSGTKGLAAVVVTKTNPTDPNDDIRYRSAQPFYSNAEMAVQGVKQEKATPEQWLAMLTKNGGLKAGEDRWLGLSDWLKEQKGSVTKQEILDYINANKIEIEEVNYSESPTGDEREIQSIRLDYTTEGLENKREIAFVVPNIEPYEEDDYVHFGDAGNGRAVVWVRFGDMTEYNETGEDKVLVIDEIQSNRHQRGREKGYASDAKDMKAVKSDNKWKIYKDDMYLGWVPTHGGIDSESKAVDTFAKYHKIPDAPFEKNWHELVMKRMLRYAAENGYARVAWIPGATQAERYNIGIPVASMSSQDNNIEQFEDGTQVAKDVKIHFKGGRISNLKVDSSGNIHGGMYDGRTLSEVVGKDLASKLMAEGDQMIDGEKIVLGGEGMKGFYDKMLVDFMNKYGKKWGVKVSTEMTVLGEEMHVIDVTDAMVRSVMEGQPMFRVKSDRQESIKTRQRAENIMKDAIAPMATELGVEVNYVTNEDISDVEPGARKKRQSKGWYQDGKVYINLSTHETIADAKETYLHEVVAHYGLRGLLKDQFEPVMQKVFASLTPTQQQSLLENFADEVEAAEEFLASMAENDIDPTIVEKVIGFIREALRSMGINLDNYTDGDLQYLLWRSKNSLKENAGNIETARWEAKDAEVRYRTVGRPAGYSTNDLEMNWWDRQMYNFQDRMRPVKKLMDEIANRKGVIDETSDPHSQEFLSASRADSEIQDFKETKYEPLAKAISEGVNILMDKLKLTSEEARNAVNDFLYARHAIERNRSICVGEISDAVTSKVKDALKVLIDRKVNADLSRRYGTLTDLNNIPYGEVESARVSASSIFNENAILDDNMQYVIKLMSQSAYDSVFGSGGTPVDTSSLTADQKLLYKLLKPIADKAAKEISKQTAKDETTGKTVVIANNRSGMSDAEAKKILADYYTADTKTAMDEISAKVKAATNFTLDKWLEYGLISQEEYDTYQAQYEYYIPLRGWQDKEDIDYTEIPSRQFNMASELINLNTHAKGRWSKAENPLAYIASLAMSACITGNRNLIRQNAFNMIDKNAHKIADLAVIEATYELLDDEGNVIGFSRKAPSQDLFDKGLVRVKKDLTYRWNKTNAQLGAHRVPVMIDGVRHVMYFKGKLGAQVAVAINGTGNDTRNIVMQNMAKYTRWISSNLTAKNVYFIVKNTIRDLMFGNFAYFVENGAGKSWKLNKTWFKALGVAYRDAMGKTTDPLYHEFKQNGGQTGYIQLENIDKLGREMERLIQEAGKNNGRWRMPLRQAAKFFEACGKASENAMRFAVYKVEREAGASEKQAAIRAKEITVNFNRQGKNSKYFNSLYAFFNPAVQGSTRFFGLMVKHPARFATAMGTMFAVKLALSWLCQAATDGDDELEGMTAYDRLSDYVKATNYVIPLGGDKFMCIPIAQSVRGPLSIADGLIDVFYGKKTIEDLFKDYLLFNIGEFAPLDIDAIDLTGDDPWATVLQTATPTVARPVMEAYVLNRDFMGNPVHKEPFLRDDDITPEHQLAFKSTTPFLVGTSKFLNEMAGGDEKRSAKYQISQNGLIEKSGLNIFDINPASVEHVLSGYFGGPAKVFIDMYNVAYGAASEDVDIQSDSYPIINQFLKTPTSEPGYKEFYQMIEYGKAVEDLFSEYGSDIDKPETSDEIKAMFGNKFNQEVLSLSKSAGEEIRDRNREILSKTDNEEKAVLTKARDQRVKEFAEDYSKLKKRYGIK